MDIVDIILAKALAGGGGGAATIQPLSVSANGEYTVPEGVDGFSPVTVSVPASAVVSGTKPITDNGVVDVAQYASADVNIPKAGEAWPLTLKVDSGSACAAVYENPYNLNRDGYFSLDGGSAHFSSFSIAKGGEKVINLAVLDRSDQGFSGHCIQDFLIVRGSTNGMQSMAISSNATATLMGTFTYGKKFYGIIKVEGQKNKVLVQNPYVSVSFSTTA